MVSLDIETVQMPSPRLAEPCSSPRISFSADFLDESEFISITPSGRPEAAAADGIPRRPEKPRNQDPNFEFRSSADMGVGGEAAMLTADELFFEGKLLPFRAMQQAEKLSKINLKTGEGETEQGERGGRGRDPVAAVGRIGKDPPAPAPTRTISWSFLDDDPSPRPPKCTVLWKELLRLKKHQNQRPSFSSSGLSPSSSSSSTSSSSSSMADAADEKKKTKTTTAASAKADGKQESDIRSHVKRIKKGLEKGLERTRSGNIRIRPMVNVPICTPTASRGGGGGGLPPLFPLKKGRV